MRVIEILEFNREMLEKLRNAGVRMDDCRFIELYGDYTRMRGNGDKVTYIVATLAAKYEISERKVYKLISFFRSECKIGAV